MPGKRQRTQEKAQEVRLVELQPPVSGELPDDPPVAMQPQEYVSRIKQLLVKAGEGQAPLDWVVVYGDREHPGNISFLSGYDPRFEEALLVVGSDGRRAIIVGNEGLSYVPTTAGRLVEGCKTVLCQGMSLMGQDRSTAPKLTDALKEAGLGQGAKVGVVGWKYLEPNEGDATVPSFVPNVVVEAVRSVVEGPVRDATPLMLDPASGLRSVLSATQISCYAWAAERASAAVARVIRAAAPQLTERRVASHMAWAGEPLSCHFMLASASPCDGQVVGLRSPTGRVLKEGDGITTAVGLWGGLCSRAGLLSGAPDASAQSPLATFQRNVVSPYFRALAAWWSGVRLGATAGAVAKEVVSILENGNLRSALNPGHLTGGPEEWTHSMFHVDSTVVLRSGMMLQCDIIPVPHPDGVTLNCEDTAVLADEALRAAIRDVDPELMKRAEERQAFMREKLGIPVADEMLPMSLAPCCLAPFWLSPDMICALQ